MTRKLVSVYTAQKTNSTLQRLFGDNQEVKKIIKRMSLLDKALFAAMCDGYTVTNTGYDSPADFEVHRASAPVCVLRNLYLPVQTDLKLTPSGRAGLFFISPADVERLQNKPKEVIGRCRQIREGEKYAQAIGTVKRLCRKWGKNEVLKMINP